MCGLIIDQPRTKPRRQTCLRHRQAPGLEMRLHIHSRIGMLSLEVKHRDSILSIKEKIAAIEPKVYIID